LFKAVLITSALGTLLALTVSALKPITRSRFSSAWHYYVWLIVLVVMVMPVRLSFEEKPPQSIARETVTDVTQETQQIATDSMAEMAPSFKYVPEGREEIISFDIVSKIWLFVTVLLFSSKVLGYAVFCAKVRKSSHLSSLPQLSLFTDKSIEVRKSGEIASPFIMGLFKPILLLPDIEMTKEQIINILSHEMTHFKRRDVLYKWFALTVKCIHWFNPFVYFITSQINIECEISCDMKVVENMTREEEIGYVNTVLSLVSVGNSRFVAFTSNMTSNRKVLKRRFEMIKNKFKVSKKTAVISIVLSVLLLSTTVFASGIVNGKLLETPEKETKDSTPISEEQQIPDVEVKDEEGTPLESEEAFIPVYPCDGELSRGFSSGDNDRPHVGIDIIAPKGTEVVSAISGTVVFAGYDTEKGYYVTVESGDIEITNAHLDSVCVSTGDVVSCGQVIGTVGTTGISTGPHLHFEVTKEGEYIDPEEFLN